MTINREPSAILSALGALLASLTKVVVILDVVTWDADQLAAVSLVIDTLIIFLGAVFIRSQVTPTASPALKTGTEVRQLDPVTGQPTGDTTTV